MNLSDKSRKNLQHIVELSHQFGTTHYVCGGGGNVSVKNQNILWIKASGTTLSSITSETFLAMDREILSNIFRIDPPADPQAREAIVKQYMAQAVLPRTPGRASVEAPLHNTIDACFVVHTHPAIVNGMTCSRQAEDACRELFPEALWLDYIDPGYTLCMKVRQKILQYKTEYKREPAIIFLKNHGVFVAADDPQSLRNIYDHIIKTLSEYYSEKGIKTTLTIDPCPADNKLQEVKNKIISAIGNKNLCIEASGAFDIANGPITPDHIVYSKSFALVEEPTHKSGETFKAEHGYLPQVIACENAVFGIAETQKKASLALELSRDGALVKQLTKAFGGIEYMTDRAREFIENWEVESYRAKQI